MKTQEEILQNISDIQLKKYAKDILDYQLIGGFHDASSMPVFIDRIKTEWRLESDMDALTISMSILNNEILKRYAQ